MIELLNDIREYRKKVRLSQNILAANMFLDKLFKNIKFKYYKRPKGDIIKIYGNDNDNVIAFEDEIFYYDNNNKFPIEFLKNELLLNDKTITKLLVDLVGKKAKYMNLNQYRYSEYEEYIYPHNAHKSYKN